MDDIKNPIAELNDILLLLRKANDTTTTIDVFARLFGCQPNDLSSILKGLGSILQLVEDSKLAAEKFIPDDNTIFMEPLNRIGEMVSTINLAKNWSDSKAYLDDITMKSLTFGIYGLRQFYPAAKPENIEKIRNFIEKLNVLLAECLDSDLSEDMKKLFIRHLEALRAALVKYRLDGSVELEDTLDTIVGSILRHKAIILAEPEENKEIIDKFFDMLGKVNDLISGYQSTLQLAAPAATTLLLNIIS